MTTTTEGDKHNMENTTDDIEKRVIEVISEHEGSYGCPVFPLSGGEPKDIKMDTRLHEDLDFDSLDAVEIIIALEEEFGIYILEEDADDIRTVGDIVKYVRKGLATKGNK